MKKIKPQIIGYFLTYFALGAIIASLGPTLPALAENVFVSIGAISILFTTRSLGYLTGSLLGGWLYDRFDGNRILGAMLFIAILALLGVPETSTLVILGIVFFVIGITQGGMDLGSNTLLVRVQKEGVAPYLNAMFFFAGLGSFLTPLYLAETSLRWGYRGIALLIIPIAVWVFTRPSPAIPETSHDVQSKLENRVLFAAFIALAFLFIGSEVSFGGWLFTFFMKSNLGSEKTAYALTSAFWFAIMLGRLFAIPIAARFQLTKIIPFNLSGALLSVLVLFFFRDAPLAIWVGAIGMGISAAALFPSTYTFVQENIQLSGKLTGVVWSAGSLGAMILPWLIGQQIDRFGPASMLTSFLVIWVAALIIFLAALRTCDQPAAV